MTAESTEQLSAYVLDAAPFVEFAIPKRLDPADIVRFVHEKINAQTKRSSLARLERLVAFYDLHEVCPHLLKILGSLTSADVDKGAVLARIIAANGSPSEFAQVAAMSRAIIANARNSEDIKELIELQDRLGPSVDPAPLHDRIFALRATAPGREPSRLSELGSSRLPRVRSANQVKAQVLAMQDRKKRITQELKMYLDLDYGYLEYLNPWAVARLRRETWAQQPAQQLTRNFDTALRAEVAEMFFTAANNVERMPGVLPDNRNGLRVRCLRAAAFFGQPLSPHDQAFINEHSKGQIDLLSID